MRSQENWREMSKRVYVAAPWVDREQAVPIADKLEALGYTITHKWWLFEGESQNALSHEELQNYANDDVAGVATADVVLVLNSSKSEGKAVEQGIAIALDIPIICITPEIKPSSNIFHYLDCYTHVKTIEEALEIVNGE
jgi:nucleoside 2-deoxyribosyltransferase